MVLAPRFLPKLDFTKLLPLLMVVSVALVIAFQNVDVHTYFSGWDNVHPEFNLPQYAYRTLFGAWLEFQGLGAPAAQSHLADIPRLPILLLLKLLVPDNLNRYVFVFLMFLIGGVGTFLYLQKVWLKNTRDAYRDWIASLGAVYYLLNLVTLQQFYIAFEMFTIQFAFFPFLLLSVHAVSKIIYAKSILIFFLVQLLIAPSAHQPTVFYIGALFSLFYAFFLNFFVKKNLLSALKMTLFLCLLTFFANSYWIIPNLYYLYQDSRYVIESRANVLFGPESLWSIREAADLPSFLTGAHYIFSWKDFNFSALQPEYIFDTWRNYLASSSAAFFIVLFNIFSLVGLLWAIFDREKGGKRWGILLIYSFSALCIWLGLFFPSAIIDFIYRDKSIQEALRNPVTKFTIIYSFAVSVLLSQFYEVIMGILSGKKSFILSRMLPIIVLGISFALVVYISWPSFKDDFLNKKLKVAFPSEYAEMYSYLKSRPANLRVLELPFFSQAGWGYHKWLSGNEISGHQGMGFYWFGFPQPLITPDFARWVETNDFFYHELRHALNSQNSGQLRSILTKYNIDLVIVDESAINQYNKYYDYQSLHQLLASIEAKVVWRKDFLTVYDRTGGVKRDELIVPAKIDFVSAKTDRVRRDFVSEDVGEYINVPERQVNTIFPFSDLTSLQVSDAVFENDGVRIKRRVPMGDYVLKIPGLGTDYYKTLAAVSFRDRRIQIVFPKTQVWTNNTEVILPQLRDLSVNVDGDYDAITLWVNRKPIRVNNNQVVYSLVQANVSEPIQLSYAELSQGQNGQLVSNEAKKVNFPDIVDRSWNEEITLSVSGVTNIGVETNFPIISADLRGNPAENCSFPNKGTVANSYIKSGTIYEADGFGVNCGSYNFDFLRPDYGYLMRISGKNFQGRSVKFFINYNTPNSLPEEYLGLSGDFSMNLALLPIATDAQNPYSINWETRSFGKLAKNELNEIRVAPFDLEKLSQIQLQKVEGRTPEKNTLMVNRADKFYNFLYLINADCRSGKCLVGIDQSYDSLWLALGPDLKLSPHYRYNNWANMWEVDRSGGVLIVYVPEVVSLVCLVLVLTVSFVLIGKTGVVEAVSSRGRAVFKQPR